MVEVFNCNRYANVASGTKQRFPQHSAFIAQLGERTPEANGRLIRGLMHNSG